MNNIKGTRQNVFVTSGEKELLSIIRKGVATVY